jgi:hypothetical protein
LSGLSKGLVGEDLGQDLDQCFIEGEGIAEEIRLAISSIEEGTYSGIFNGVFRLAQVAKEVPMALSDCKQISSSAITKLYVFAERFYDYNALLNRITYNMLYYGATIYTDLDTAKNSFYASDYYNSGLFAGQAIELATR